MDEARWRQQYVIKMERQPSTAKKKRKTYEYEWILSRVKKLLAIPSLQPSILLLSLNGMFKSWRTVMIAHRVCVKKVQNLCFSCETVSRVVIRVNAFSFWDCQSIIRRSVLVFFPLQKGTLKWNTGGNGCGLNLKTQETLCIWGRKWNSFGWRDERPFHLLIPFCLNGKSAACERHINLEKFNGGFIVPTFAINISPLRLYLSHKTHIYHLEIANLCKKK